MMFSKVIFCVLRAQNNPKKLKNFLKNIQFEGLCTLFFLCKIIANRFKKQGEFDHWILEKNHKLIPYYTPLGGGLQVSENSLLFFLKPSLCG